ncbi:MAG TPA: hypothetical protein PLU22_17910, partial [Polyangiaceae bacterium]|nr:hypothetical protein [Polyangiaceae bacterium]
MEPLTFAITCPDGTTVEVTVRPRRPSSPPPRHRARVLARVDGCEVLELARRAAWARPPQPPSRPPRC